MSDDFTPSEATKERIIPIDIEKEVKTSYLNYAMSVIVSRAIPDARDGLKPVHRRILYTMFDAGLHHNSKTRKCSHIVGNVVAQFHPHGLDSVYFALARLSQDFSLRYPFVIGQGNFGSIDGDPPAAFRYTEAKLSHISEEILTDIRKDTVDFMPNYDESLKEPTVLPSALPFLLLNGSTGIAVGLATEVPPHNLNELALAVIQQIDNPDISINELCNIVKGPDFPTGAIIKGLQGIRKAYTTGQGVVTVQSKYSLEQSKGYDQIVFTEIPYAKRKSEIIAHLAALVNNEVILGIRDIRDLSNRNGIRIIVELKRDANVRYTLQKILTLTDFQTNYSINMTALVKSKPKTIGLKECLQIFIDHRKEVITRKTKFELKEAESRAHILRGLLIALNNIDEVVALIKNSQDTAEASKKLMQRFELDELQSKAILDMRLHRLTSLEINKLVSELEKLEILIADLKDILAKPERVKTIIKDIIQALVKKHGDERKTEIQQAEAVSLSEEELINKKDMVVTLTKSGYIKRTNISNFKIQNRGGKGIQGTALVKNDTLDKVYSGSTHDTILFISSAGRGYAIKNYHIPETGRTSRGLGIRTLLPLQQDEQITSILRIPNFDENYFLILATKQGKIKKIVWHLLKGTTRKRGLPLLTLNENDYVVDGNSTLGKDDIFIFTRFGKALRIKAEEFRQMGRMAMGVGGIKLKNNDSIVAVLEGNDSTAFILISEKGYSKRLIAKNITPHRRKTAGNIAMKISEATGKLCVTLRAEDEDMISAISQQGKTIRFRANSSTIKGRYSRGVITFSLSEDDVVTGATISNNTEG